MLKLYFDLWVVSYRFGELSFIRRMTSVSSSDWLKGIRASIMSQVRLG